MDADRPVVLLLFPVFCSTVYYVQSDDTFLYSCIAIRLIAGCGTAMLYVSANSILLKTTTYNTNTIAVSRYYSAIGFII